MDRYDRIIQLNRIFKTHRYPLSLQQIQDKLECSSATAKRAIKTLRDDLGAPLPYDNDRGGYRYIEDPDAPQYELPGLWFTPAELHALLAAQQLLEGLSLSLLSDAIAPLRERIDKLLSDKRIGHNNLTQRVQVLGSPTRRGSSDFFTLAADALLGRHKLEIDYTSRSREERTRRTLSPQRLLHYRDNWYLAAWCHTREGLRMFSLDRIGWARRLDEAAIEVEEGALTGFCASTYGIFAGEPAGWATLRFSRGRAEWVADETWHPKQRSQWLPDGRYELEIPYSKLEELTLDVLRHIPEVEVVGPQELRVMVRERVEAAWRGMAETTL